MGRGSAATQFKPGQVANPNGRPKGPMMPTIILKDAYLMAAKIAGGGGDDGLVNYLVEQAKLRPVAFLSGLNRIIPMEIHSTGNGNIKIEVIQRFGDEHPEPKLINGNANGHDAAASANGAAATDVSDTE